MPSPTGACTTNGGFEGQGIGQTVIAKRTPRPTWHAPCLREMLLKKVEEIVASQPSTMKVSEA